MLWFLCGNASSALLRGLNLFEKSWREGGAWALQIPLDCSEVCMIQTTWCGASFILFDSTSGIRPQDHTGSVWCGKNNNVTYEFLKNYHQTNDCLLTLAVAAVSLFLSAQSAWKRHVIVSMFLKGCSFVHVAMLPNWWGSNRTVLPRNSQGSIVLKERERERERKNERERVRERDRQTDSAWEWVFVSHENWLILVSAFLWNTQERPCVFRVVSWWESCWDLRPFTGVYCCRIQPSLWRGIQTKIGLLVQQLHFVSGLRAHWKRRFFSCVWEFGNSSVSTKQKTCKN